MSTKIYEAYKVDKSIDALKLFNILKNIKKEVIAFYKNLSSEQWIIDLHKLQFSSTATEEQKKLFEKMFGSRLQTDVTESCVVYFHKTGTYIQFFMNRKLEHLYNKNRKFKDFHYQDQADMPSNINEKEWNDRRKIWEDIYKDADTPAASGLTYNFYTFKDFDWQLFSNAFKPKENKNENINNKSK